MNSLEKTIKELSDRLKGKINTPIIVGGWAINLLGWARQTIDFDFMVLENEFNKILKKIRDG